MPKASTTGSSAAWTSAWAAVVVASTRIKKLPVAGLPYCCESVILQPATSRAPATAWTIPGRSGQDRVTTYAWFSCSSLTNTSLPARTPAYLVVLVGSQLALGG